MAPPRMNFQSGFLANTADLDTTRIDDSLRSFMDKGESVFENEDGRADVIQGIRNTILAKMRDANKASADDADRMEQEHIRFSETQMTPLIVRAKKVKREADLAYAQYLLAKSRTGSREAADAALEIDRLIQSAESGIGRLISYNLIDSSGDSGDAGNPAAGGAADALADVSANAGLAVPERSAEDSASAQALSDAMASAMGVNAAGANAMGAAVVGANAAGANAGANSAANAAANTAEAVLQEASENTEERMADYSALQEIQRGIHDNLANTRSRFVRFVTFVNTRKNRARARADRARTETTALTNEITERANRWDEIRSRYKENTFRKHYANYDTLAQAYYSYTRKLEGSDERSIGRVKDELGGGEASKKIAEYTGVYDTNQLEDIKQKVSTAPYDPTPELKRVKNKALGANSVNTESADKPVKFHRAIVMTAFAEGVNNATDEESRKTARVRMKLMSNFRGYRARRQFTDNTNTALMDTQESAESRNKGDLQGASQMNLTADERGRNGAYLVSENSAKIYNARTRLFGGQEVHGFYHNGQFYSDDYNTMQDMSQASRLRSPNWNSVRKEEQAREAIRRSDFFYHVNSGTIQHYMSYNPDDEFGKESAQETLHTATTENAPESVKSIQLLESYLDPNTDSTAKNTALTELTAAAMKVADTEKKDFGPSLAIMLLSEDDPKLWTIARDMAEKMGGRYAARLKGIPQTGEVMRITLVEELANDRKFDWTDIGASLRPDRLNMHIEDLSAKRAGFFSLTNLRQSFWDGSLLDVITDSYSGGKDIIKNAGLEGTAFDQIKSDFTSDYLDAVSTASTNFGLMLAPVPGIVAGMTGGMDSEGDVSDEADYTMSSVSMFQSVVDFVESVATLVKNIQSIKKAKKKGDPIFPVIMKLIGTVIKLLNNLVSMIAIWLDTPAMKGVTSVFSTVKTIFGVIRSTVDIVRTSFEISALKESDKDIETALTDYNAQRETLQSANTEVTQSTLTTTKERMGMAATNNSQAQYFLALAKSRARRERKTAVMGTITGTINSIGNFIGMGSKLSWFNPISFPFKLAGKVSQFIGWTIGKIHDASSFNDNLSRTIGISGISNWGAFDEAVKRETGIKSRHYLVDLARIFMAIDTHHMVRDTNKAEGETALSISLMAPYLKIAGAGDERFDANNLTENANRLKKVKLGKLLNAVGGPDNWRAVLRMSITG